MRRCRSRPAPIAEIALELQRIQQAESALAAYRAELICELAARRPDTTDRQLGKPGAASPDWLPGPGNPPSAGVSEFFADELAMVLNCSRAEATTQAELSTTLVEHLPATWAALADSALGWPRARAVAAELSGPVRELAPQVIAAVEAAVLPGAPELPVTRVRAAVRRELLHHDAAAAERRRRQAERCADVVVHPAPDGMAELSVFLPQPMAVAIRETVDRYGRMAKDDGDPRPIGQLRVSALGDLVLRPWDTSRLPVTAHLDVLAPVGALFAAATGHDTCPVGHQLPHHADAAPVPGDPSVSGGPASAASCRQVAPAEVEGQPITAAQLRALLEGLDALCPGGLQAPTGGSLGISLLDPATGVLRATATRGELARSVRRGCPAHPGADCACPVLGPPAPSHRYRPSAVQHRFTRSRDRGCRHPGCGNRAGWADLDHVLPHADGGATACENLCCLCPPPSAQDVRSRLAFRHDARRPPEVTTPSGVARTTRPPDMAATTPDGATRTTRPPDMAATGPPPSGPPLPARPPGHSPVDHSPPPATEDGDPAPF
ncbi:DUF222 domain-containing protein [Blastococcus sp. SYSU DS0973]